MEEQQLVGKSLVRGSWKFSIQTGQLSICPALKRMLSLSANISSPLVLLSLLEKGEKIKVLRGLLLALRSAKSWQVELQLTDGEGRPRAFILSVACYQRRWGKVDKIIGTMEDLARQRQVERMLNGFIGRQISAPVCLAKVNLESAMRANLPLLTQKHHRELTQTYRAIEKIESVFKDYNQPRLLPLADISGPQSVFELQDLLAEVLSELRASYQSYHFIEINCFPVWVEANKLQLICMLFDQLLGAMQQCAGRGEILISMMRSDHYTSLAFAGANSGKKERQINRINASAAPGNICLLNAKNGALDSQRQNTGYSVNY